MLVEKLVEPDRGLPISVFPLEDGSLFRDSTKKEARERRIVSWKIGTRLKFTKGLTVGWRSPHLIQDECIRGVKQSMGNFGSGLF